MLITLRYNYHPHWRLDDNQGVGSQCMQSIRLFWLQSSHAEHCQTCDVYENKSNIITILILKDKQIYTLVLVNDFPCLPQCCSSSPSRQSAVWSHTLSLWMHLLSLQANSLSLQATQYSSSSPSENRKP